MDRQTCKNILEKLEWKNMLPYNNLHDGTAKLAEYSIFNVLSEGDIDSLLSSSQITNDSSLEDDLLLNEKSTKTELCSDNNNDENIIIDRIKGSLCGLAIADSVGGPLEFLSAISTNKIPSGKDNLFKKQTVPTSLLAKTGSSLFSCFNLKRTNEEPSYDKRNLHLKKKDGAEPIKNANKFGVEPTELHYKYQPMNKFYLKPGQFTDDTSMALCLADSLIYSTTKFLYDQSLESFESGETDNTTENAIEKDMKQEDMVEGINKGAYRNIDTPGSKNRLSVKFRNQSLKVVLQEINKASSKWDEKEAASNSNADRIEDESISAFYDGKDLRSRFVCWWNQGYNNSFRLDDTRPTHQSVGLGGNIGASLREISNAKSPKQIPSTYERDCEDAGNGSIMRLAPVAIRFCNNLELALKVAKHQSEATHPGRMASEACRFLAFILVKAITRPNSAKNLSHSQDDIKMFLDACVVDYLKKYEETTDPTFLRLIKASEKSDSLEENWNWRARSLPLYEVCKRRINADPYGKYNGYEVIRGYFGSYAPDGLALALFSAYNTTNYDDAIQLCVNHLGDADTTSAICGQICGAFYGFDSINPILKHNLCVWDRNEIALRALVLYSLQQFDQSI